MGCCEQAVELSSPLGNRDFLTGRETVSLSIINVFYVVIYFRIVLLFCMLAQRSLLLDSS
jgi:hypothetical protein